MVTKMVPSLMELSFKETNGATEDTGGKEERGPIIIAYKLLNDLDHFNNENQQVKDRVTQT